MAEYKKYLNVAVRAARVGGRMLMAQYGKLRHVHYKANTDIVTAADIASERAILALLRKHFPQHSTYSEEAGKRTTASPYEWIIDPLDGTTNYATRNPFFNVSIALNYRGETIVGVVHNPYTGELFSAALGGGAYLNGKRIRCSRQADLGKSFIAFCYGTPTPPATQRAVRLYGMLKRKKVKYLRQIGAAALELCYVAAGRIDGFWMSHTNAYDVAAGALIAREAGCTVTDFTGKRFTAYAKHLFVANPAVHRKLLSVFRRF